jgi:hypothetical protein
LDLVVPVGVGLSPNPIGIRIFAFGFMARPEKAFGGAFEICLKKVCGNIHLQLEVLWSDTTMDSAEKGLIQKQEKLFRSQTLYDARSELG